MMMPAAAVVAWGAAVYRPGDETAWISYARLNGWPPFFSYITRSIHDIGSLYLELLPASLLIPFIPWPWRRNQQGDRHSAGRRADDPLFRRMHRHPGVVAGLQHPLCHADRTVARRAGRDRLGPAGAIALCDRAPRGDYGSLPARDLSVRACPWSLCRFFRPIRREPHCRQSRSNRRSSPSRRRLIVCVSTPISSFMCTCRCGVSTCSGMAALDPPAWLLMPHAAVAEFAQLRPDLDVRIVKDGLTEHQFTATRIERK